jgi:hypothetical protein
MNCPNCKSENPEANNYCGSCGVALKPESDRLRRDIVDAVEAELARSLKDRDVVEVEVSEAVMTRVIGWAKTFGLVTGVPLGIAALVLAMLGIRTYSDLYTMKALAEQTKITAKNAQDEIKSQVQQAKKSAEIITSESEDAELESKARNFTDQYDYSDAAATLKQLCDKHEKDELLFRRLVEAYVAANNVTAAIDLIGAKFKSLDARQVGTFVQAGHVLMRYEIEKQVRDGRKITADTHLSLKDAEQMLEAGRALKGAEDDQLNYKNLMGELGLCYALESGDSWPKAKTYGQQWAEKSKQLGPADPWEPPTKEKWTAQLNDKFVAQLKTDVFK